MWGKCSKAEFREGLKAMGGKLGQLPISQIDDIFEYMDSKSEQTLRLEHFISVFSTDKRKKIGHDGKSDIKDSARTKARSFTEVLMQCKDEGGVEKNISVQVTIKWEDLLQKLKTHYHRAVTFMYEDSSQHKYTVKDAKDLTQCWDGLAKSGKGEEGSMHLECMIVEFDSKMAKGKGGKTTGRPSLAERRDKATKVSGAASTDLDRDPVESLDFRSRHRWIDDMMRLLGAPLENEPAAMNNKWDILVHECVQLDSSVSKTVSIEGFRNALTRTEPRMTADDVAWFVRDADKDQKGDVLYDTYAKTKKQGQSSGQNVSGGVATHERDVTGATEKIKAALKSNFKSLQQAFKRMDMDRDGRLSREEFRKGVEQRLKLRLPAKLLDEVIRKADQGGDGYIDYEDFLTEFNSLERTEDVGSVFGTLCVALCVAVCVAVCVTVCVAV